MTPRLAQIIREHLLHNNLPQLTIAEILIMPHLPTIPPFSGMDVYAIQKDEITIIVWVKPNYEVQVQAVSWPKKEV